MDKSNLSIEELTTLANNGDAEAQYLLGRRYDCGEGVEKDIAKAVEWYRKSAEHSYAAAQNNLGVCYRLGEGVEKDTTQAIELWTKSAEQGNADAQYNLGLFYESGDGVEKDRSKAVEWYTQAAEQEYPAAQNNLGRCYYWGEGAEKDRTKAAEWYTKSAEHGDAEAQCNLGWCYEWGEGVEKDIFKAVELYTLSAEQGDVIAQNNLGECYEEGKGVEKDMAKALELYILSAEQRYTVAQNNLGGCYYWGKGAEKDVCKATYWWGKAAEQGDDAAQYSLGVCYFDGEGVEKDVTKAVELYTLSAEQGNAAAQNNLGWCYANGKGVEKDMDKAVDWYTKAAEQGNVGAQNNLGACHYKGEGVEKNTIKAVEWYTKAADQGESTAQNNLGMCYENGEGVEKDMTKAVEWYTKAAEQGNAYGQCNLGVCYYKGEGVEVDIFKAVELFTQAAEQGYAYAQYNLGWCYYWGKGAEKDVCKATYWWGKAVEQGLAAAQCDLGYCYELGEGVEKNISKAVELYTLSAEQGETVAQSNLGECYEKGKGVEKDVSKAVDWYEKAAAQGFEEAQEALERLRQANKKELEKAFDIANFGCRYDVFLSWNHNDIEFKNKLVSLLEEYNFDDTGTRDGKVYAHFRAWESDRDANGTLDGCIENAIKSSKLFLIILSENSLKSPWVKKEAAIALERVKNNEISKQNIIVVYLNNGCDELNKIDDKDNSFYELKDYTAIFTDGKNDEKSVNDICLKIKEGLEAEAVRNYQRKQTEDSGFKFALRRQADAANRMAAAESALSGIKDSQDTAKRIENSIMSTIMSFQDGFVMRDLIGENGKDVAIDGVLSDNKSIYICGEGGSGKSLYLSYLIGKNFGKDNRFFIRINLLKYDEEIDGYKNLSEMLNDELNSYLTESDEYKSTKALLRARNGGQNKLVIVFDGVDEISVEKFNKIKLLIAEHRKIEANIGDRYIFASRTTDHYAELEYILGKNNLAKYHLRGFDRHEQRKLYDNIIKANEKKYKDMSEEQIKNLKDTFFVSIEQISNEITRNPLLLSNLIFIYLMNRGSELPTNKLDIVDKTVGIFITELEEDRKTIDRFEFKKYLNGKNEQGCKLSAMLEYIAFGKVSGNSSEGFDRLIVEYLTDSGVDNAETLGAEIYDFLCRRAIITKDKITHDIFTVYFACCYLYKNIYMQNRNKFKQSYIDFKDREWLDFCLNVEPSAAWVELSSELIMKLDSEIHRLNDKVTMNEKHLSYVAFDETLTKTLTERGFCEQAVKTVIEVLNHNGFYYNEFIRNYVKVE